jgi:hypothetical protein
MFRTILFIEPRELAAYLKLDKENISDSYANKMSILFDGMQANGNSFDNNKPQNALSTNAIDEFCYKHEAEAGLHFEKKHIDNDGNKIVIYIAPMITEIFILPKK